MDEKETSRFQEQEQEKETGRHPITAHTHEDAQKAKSLNQHGVKIAEDYEL